MLATWPGGKWDDFTQLKFRQVNNIKFVSLNLGWDYGVSKLPVAVHGNHVAAISDKSKPSKRSSVERLGFNVSPGPVASLGFFASYKIVLMVLILYLPEPHNPPAH